MTTPSTAPDALRPEQEDEGRHSDIDALAQFCGWRTSKDLDDAPGVPGTYAWMLSSVPTVWAPGGGCFHFDPFKSAATDLMVLERAREVWCGRSGKWHDFVLAYARAVTPLLQPTLTVVLQRHECGMYSRAVLTVLRSTETRG